MRHTLLNSLMIGMLLFQAFPNTQVSANTSIAHPDNSPRRAFQADSTPPVINHSTETGMVTFIGTSNGAPIPVSGANSPNLQTTEKANVVLSVYGPMFGIDNPQTELSLEKSETTGENRNFFRYQQLYQGIPVMAGEIILNTTFQGDLYSMSGEASPNLNLSTTPQITSEQATAQALELMGSRYGADQANLTLTEPKLWIYDERLLRPSTKPAELVWRVDAQATDGKPLDVLILVNAEHGGISLQFNQTDTDVTGKAWLPAASQADDPPTKMPTETPVPSATLEPTATPTLTELPTETLIPTDTLEPTSTTIPTATAVPTETETPTGAPDQPIPENPVENAGSGVTWYVATTGNDTNDCQTTLSPCATINGAIGKANSSDTIKIAVGTYTGSGTNAVVTISKSIFLSGGWDASFSSQTGLATIDGQVTLSGISILAGTTTIEFFNIKNGYSGIINSGTLVLNQTAVTGNSQSGIKNSGTLTMNRSTVSGNRGAQNGGGIDNISGVLALNNSTISGNFGGYGGGLAMEAGSGTLSNTTIAKNTSYYGGGIGKGSSGSGGTVTMRNSILASNGAQYAGIDSYLNITSSGYNLIGNTVGFTFSSTTGDQVNVSNPRLGSLVGLPGFHPLLSSSPAKDAGNPLTPGSGGNACLATDERGIARPVGSACDIGAFEYEGPGPASSIVVSGGDSQRASPGNTFATPMSAMVLDKDGNLVSGTSVSFIAPSSGASGVFSDTGTNTTTALTSEAGITSAASFSANTILGAYAINAFVTGVTDPAVFHLENIAWFVAPTGNDANNCKDPLNPCATINAAIGKANSGEMIYAASGTYTGSGTNPVVTIGKNITLSGGWDTSFASQSDMAIIDGQNSRGGLTISGQANVSVANFIIQDGYTRGGGSGINDASANTLTLTNCIVRSNTNYDTTYAGGAIYQGGTITLNNSSVTGNTWNGIYALGKTIVLNSSTVSKNGGVGVNSGLITLNNSTVSGNADSGIISSSTLTLNNSTVSNNHTTQSRGGGIVSSGGTVTLHNSIVAGNNSPTAPDCSGTIGSAGYNIIGDTTGCTFNSIIGDQVNVNPKLGLLVGSPGYHPLWPSSPAVDSGNACLATDERGTPRPIGAACDIGAYEYSAPGPGTQIVVAGGDLQYSLPSTDFGLPLQVVILDSLGRPVNGIPVTFTAPSSGASSTFTGSGTNTITLATDEGGAASATSTANAIYGSYSVFAVANGVTGSAEFHLSNMGWYVAPNGNDTNSCRAPTQACGSINMAISKANLNDTIFVASGTYTGNTTDPVVTINKGVILSGGWDGTFTSQNGTSVIDGGQVRRAVFIPTNNYKITIEHFTIQNVNIPSYGGGISVNGDLTLNYTNVINNTVTNGDGGGIRSSGTLILNHSIVSGNTASGNNGEGGGIYHQGLLILNNSIIDHNISSSDGGGLYLGVSTATISNSTISNNSTNSNNSVLGRGGGIFMYGGTLTLDNSIVSTNSARRGGGIFNYSGGIATIRNSTIADNIAVASAGQYAGGGIYNDTNLDVSKVDIQNSILARNTGVPRAPDCFVGSTWTITSNGYNLVGNDNSCTFASTTGDLVGHWAYPINPRLGPLTSSAGVLYQALLTGSPAIDAGNPAAPDSGGTACLGTDVRGIVRPVGSRCDIGAYEGTSSGTLPPLVSVYSAGNGTTLPGTFLCDQNQPGCTNGSDPNADSALAFFLDTFQFYMNHHQRYSLDGAGMAMLSSIHYGSNYQNSFWNGTEAVFGDNWTTDDTVGHELTHAVTQYTSGLYYYYQSGAISESFSDLWGEFIDQTDGAGNDSPAVKWLLGEDNVVYRSMSNPPAYNQPDKMTSSLYQHGDQEDLNSVNYDNGGVHTNSGIDNKAVYLMIDGGSFNGYTISGLGLNKVAAIYYEAQVHLLTSGSNYNDLYYALHQACLNIIAGPEGVTLADCSQVQNALDAVEMNKDPLSGFMPEAELCPIGTQPKNLFFDDLESGSTKWDFSNHTPSTIYWNPAPGYAADGQFSLYGTNAAVTSDISATMASGLYIPSTGTYYLYFKHAFGFEYDPSGDGVYRTWDGGVLEYSVDNGTWQDAQSLFDSGQGYNGSVYNYSGATNPLAGRSAFVRDSHGYISSRYNLSAPAIRGHNIQFRWRVGSNESVGTLGWVVDDVRIYSCRIKPSIRDDYDGDGKSDPVIFVPSTGAVWWLSSSTGQWDGKWLGGDTFQYVYGSDFDGDGKTDPAKFYSATGTVWWINSSTGLMGGQWLGPDLFQYITGSDFDGDGKADPAKFYPATGTVWWVNSSTSTLGGQWLGADSFQYVSGSDFDGDGKTDPAKFYPSTGTVWWVRSSDHTMDGMWLGPDAFTYVSASDFDGDGKTDPAKFYPDTGTVWWVRSSDGAMDGAWLGPGTFTYIAGDDFNGDGKTDPAKYDASTYMLSWLDTTTGIWTDVDMGTGTYDVVNGQ